jgi:hypothetical protein
MNKLTKAQAECVRTFANMAARDSRRSKERMRVKDYQQASFYQGLSLAYQYTATRLATDFFRRRVL